MPPRTLHRGPSDVVVDADDARPLLDVLRAELRVRSAARGCQDGTCGSCRVLLDGRIVASCTVAWSEVRDGARIETYEDVALDPAAVRAVEAFGHERPTRCKMCVGALGVTAVAIARVPERVERAAAIEEALATATCMCTGRGSWRRALSK
jgi:aerobic-type carbon monoxide dehydrogenase small subunit (CoxS/CutS family)